MQSLYGQADERLKAEALRRRIAARTTQIAALLDEKIRQLYHQADDRVKEERAYRQRIAERTFDDIMEVALLKNKI